MNHLRRYCLLLDLVDNEQLIKEYEDYHVAVWPEIRESIKSAGITNMEIYRVGNRLSMLMEVDDTFSFETKSKADDANPKVQQWETLMSKFQQPLPLAKEGEKWMLMQKIFDLNK